MPAAIRPTSRGWRSSVASPPASHAHGEDGRDLLEGARTPSALVLAGGRHRVGVDPDRVQHRVGRGHHRRWRAGPTSTSTNASPCWPYRAAVAQRARVVHAAGAEREVAAADGLERRRPALRPASSAASVTDQWFAWRRAAPATSSSTVPSQPTTTCRWRASEAPGDQPGEATTPGGVVLPGCSHHRPAPRGDPLDLDHRRRGRPRPRRRTPAATGVRHEQCSLRGNGHAGSGERTVTHVIRQRRTAAARREGAPRHRRTRTACDGRSVAARGGPPTGGPAPSGEAAPSELTATAGRATFRPFSAPSSPDRYPRESRARTWQRTSSSWSRPRRRRPSSATSAPVQGPRLVRPCP